MLDALLEGNKLMYALRLTPYPNTAEKAQWVGDRIGSFVEAAGAEDYIFGQEFERNHHFHIVFSIVDELSGSRLCEFKDFLYDFFEVPDNKKGNPTYSLDLVRDKTKALCYAVKDGRYSSSERWVQLVSLAYKNSKTKKHSMKSSLSNLIDDYIDGHINDRDLWVGLGQARAELGLPLSIRWIDEMMFSIQCKKDPELLIQKWEERIIKSSLKS